ncbi:hypothetical protein IEQ34_025026 [Dendrobium chrysotoxum]|uniref:Uncharacterized protein n=1 Tax=Dendrobium chrysotoxum TaxID=161865 RepID=A0AAV7FQY7_DENCH|nr:hypothetical protein IEQ34_025026 [Dendrobium chrysotoxum]
MKVSTIPLRTGFVVHMSRADLRISPLHTKFHSPLSHSSELVSRAFRQFWRLELETRFTAYVPFTPSHPKNTCPPRLTAAAGTELAGASSSSPVRCAHSTKELYKRHMPFFTHAILLGIGLSPIVQDSPLLPPVDRRPCLSPSVADHHPKDR